MARKTTKPTPSAPPAQHIILIAENYNGASRPVGHFPPDLWKLAALADFRSEGVPFRADYYYVHRKDTDGIWRMTMESIRSSELPGSNTMATAP